MKYLIIISLLFVGACGGASADYVTRSELRDAYECLQARSEYERQAEICQSTEGHTETEVRTACELVIDYFDQCPGIR